MSSPFPQTFIIVAYIYFVTSLGPKIMENRKAFDLKSVLVVYNFVVVMLSLYMCYEVSCCVWSQNELIFIPELFSCSESGFFFPHFCRHLPIVVYFKEKQLTHGYLTDRLNFSTPQSTFKVAMKFKLNDSRLFLIFFYFHVVTRITSHCCSFDLVLLYK